MIGCMWVNARGVRNIMTDNVITWYGKPIEDLTKEELIEVIQYSFSELAKYQTAEARRAYAIGKVEILKGR